MRSRCGDGTWGFTGRSPLRCLPRPVRQPREQAGAAREHAGRLRSFDAESLPHLFDRLSEPRFDRSGDHQLRGAGLPQADADVVPDAVCLRRREKGVEDAQRPQHSASAWSRALRNSEGIDAGFAREAGVEAEQAVVQVVRRRVAQHEWVLAESLFDVRADHERRDAVGVGGKKIKKGDKIVLWYVSANRDETVIPRANEFLIDRENSKQHLSFGWGVHFCMGSRLAEMQLRVLWEEILRRFRFVEVVGEPVRVKSPFVKGFEKLPVRVHPW